MYEERETFDPANLSILAMRSPERVRDVFVFILALYYQGRISATGDWSAETKEGLFLKAIERSKSRVRQNQIPASVTNSRRSDKSNLNPEFGFEMVDERAITCARAAQ
jgi:hypothetical protein